MKIVAFRAVHPMNQNAAFRPAISAHNPGPGCSDTSSESRSPGSGGSTALNPKYLGACCR